MMFVYSKIAFFVHYDVRKIAGNILFHTIGHTGCSRLIGQLALTLITLNRESLFAR